MNIIKDSDVIIIGAGLAGIYTALNIDPRLKVLVLSKECIYENNSVLAQGGIAAKVKEDDDFILHIEDSLKAGSRLNDLEALRTLITEAPTNIDKLIKFGVEFDKDDRGNIKTTMEGGHSRRRILHAGGDATGKEIIKALSIEARNRKNIFLYENIIAIDLIVEDNNCIGIKAIYDEKIYELYSKDIVIATGGIGSVYKRSTNALVATGDGIAIGYRAGLEIHNMEFIQFHPTAFYSESEGKKFLVSEAVRGEGAILRNINNERFMPKYHKDAELAPRDIVSQSIFEEMKKTNSKYVYLDITHKDNVFVKERFPNIYKNCLDNGVDITKDFIPVSPVEHYSIGGIKIDINGRSSIKGLYACGECADSGVHGANRLASNSLLECVVFGRRIAKDVNDNNYNYKHNYKTNYYDVSEIVSNLDLLEIKETIKDTMSEHVGIVRYESELFKAMDIIKDIKIELEENIVKTKDYYEVLNMATTAYLILEACIERKESIGCHFRINNK